MVETFSFIRNNNEELISINVTIGITSENLILDTGASHTFIDFGILINEGFRLDNSIGLVPVETANGIIYANKFIVPVFKCFNITKLNFEVTSFIFDNPSDEYKGVLGLDFWGDLDFCISLKKAEIKISQ
jgi:hypothetical protein